jgi:hypothetical protein
MGLFELKERRGRESWCCVLTVLGVPAARKTGDKIENKSILKCRNEET